MKPERLQVMRVVKVDECVQNIFYKILTELIKYFKSCYPKETTVVKQKFCYKGSFEGLLTYF